MRLALKLGEPDVDAMLAGMTARQFAEWRHFGEHLEPFGPLIDLRLAGTLCATVANFAAFRGKDAPVLKPETFFPELVPDPLEPQTPEQMRAAMGAGKKGKRG